MNEFNGMYESIINKAVERTKEAHPMNVNDVFGTDGLLRCAVCGEPKEEFFEIPGFGTRKGGCDCRCDRERKAAEEMKKKKEANEKRRQAAFGSVNSKRFSFTFENDDGQNRAVSEQLKLYCDNFKKYRKDGSGLMIYSSSNGGGKTFLACAIANRLIDEGYTVRVSDMLELRDELFKGDKRAFLLELRRNDLVIIDDIGTESANANTLEAEYRIINDLTENYIPLVVTTNYTPKELAESNDRDKRRIFDRILGVCVPVRVDPPNGRSRRIVNCQRLLEDFKSVNAAE